MLNFDNADKLTTLGLSFSSLLFYAFYNRYKNRQLSANQVESAVDVIIGSNLKEELEGLEDHRIAYASVEGVVKALGSNGIVSQYDNNKFGVIKQATLREHKSKRVNGFWSDAKRTIKNIVDTIPFSLSSSSDSGVPELLVTEIGEAEYLMDELTVTYNHFEPNKASLLEIGLDRVFGEVSKGLHEKEKMLLVGTHLLGFGEIFLENGKIKMGPGQDSRYILTRLSKKEIIKKFESQSSIFKVCMIVSGLVSTGFLIYLIWKVSRRYIQQTRNRRAFEEARRGLDNNVENDGNGNECVICLTNQRDIVILNCGHVALCSDCAQVLPNELCPVCRGPINRFVPLYQS